MQDERQTLRSRLDRELVHRRLVSTRAQAQDLIRRGQVRLAGRVETKTGTPVPSGADIQVDTDASHVSRGALKLAAALDHFGFRATGAVALDVGASTGGFTQVLLDRGAARVYSVDVGHGQLHPTLAGHYRVISIERCDARGLSRSLVPDAVGAIVADVSFISLTKALPAALGLAAGGAWLVALVKPQFEAGRDAIGKGGIVRDPADRQRAVAAVSDWLAAQPGWTLAGVIPSPIKGGSGNEEFLLGAVHRG